MMMIDVRSRSSNQDPNYSKGGADQEYSNYSTDHCTFKPDSGIQVRRPIKSNEKQIEAKPNESLMAAQASIVETSGGITGAGAGGGLGLNAPGAGPKIQHFGGQGTGVKVKGLTIPSDLGDIWQKIIGDDDP